MFGRRSDGRRLNHIDPIIQFAPYIMPDRTDATNAVTQRVDYEPLASYIKKQGQNGRKVSFMSLVIAAYVRIVDEYPEINRFVVNNQIFARNHLTACVVALRNGGNMDEAIVKLSLYSDDTIFTIQERLDAEIQKARDENADNGTVDFARALLKVRPIVKLAVGVLRLLDRYGLIPASLLAVSPFHTSLFITNMASIGMPSLYHHIYNFGNTSQFISIGKFEHDAFYQKGGFVDRTVIPMGVTLDERICGGAVYAQAFSLFKKLLSHPEMLETPAETVHQEYDFARGKEMHR